MCSLAACSETPERHYHIDFGVQGRGSFEGTEQHVIWLDEEPPMDVYGECLITPPSPTTTKGAQKSGWA